MHRFINRISTKKSTPRHIMVKLLKTKNEEKILKYNISNFLSFTQKPSYININHTEPNTIPLFALSCLEHCNLNYMFDLTFTNSFLVSIESW